MSLKTKRLIGNHACRHNSELLKDHTAMQQMSAHFFLIVFPGGTGVQVGACLETIVSCGFSCHRRAVALSLCLTEGKIDLMQQICSQLPPRIEWMDE